MSELKSNLTSVIKHLAEYKRHQQYRKKNQASLAEQEFMVQKYKKDLASEISKNIMGLTKIQGSIEAYELKLAPYISDENESLRTQIAKTFIAHPELKQYKAKFIETQVLNILTRIFQIPIGQDVQKLNSAEINPLLTQLTRIMLMEPLLIEQPESEFEDSGMDAENSVIDSEDDDEDEIYFNPENIYLAEERERYRADDERNDGSSYDYAGANSDYIEAETRRYVDDESDQTNEPNNYPTEETSNENDPEHLETLEFVSEIESQAITNLGQVGLSLITNHLRDCASDIYENKNNQRISELISHLNLLKDYQSRSINLTSIDQNLLLGIIEKQIHALSQKSKFTAEDLGDQQIILELTVDILSQFDLNLDTNFIKNLRMSLVRLDPDTKEAALRLLRNTQIKEINSDAVELANQMYLLITGNHTEIENQQEKERVINNKLFATQFFIKNPKLVSLKILGSLNDPEGQVFTFAILDAALKNDSKNINKRNLLSGIAIILKSLETEKNLSLGLYNHLLLLKPLLTDPQELINIYKDQEKLDDTAIKYLAAILSSFPNTGELINRLEESDFKLILAGFLNEFREIHRDTNSDLENEWGELDLVRANILAGLENNKFLESKKIPDELWQELLRKRTGLQEFGEKLLDPRSTLNSQIRLINILGNRVIDHEEFFAKYKSVSQKNGDLLSICTKISNTNIDQKKEIELTVNKLFEFYQSFLKANTHPSLSNLRINIKNELKESLLEMGKAAEPHLYKIIQKSRQNQTKLALREAALAESVLKERNYLPELAA